MKVMICASMSFADRIQDAKVKLGKLGHKVLVTKDLQHIINNPHQPDDLDGDYAYCIENDIFRDCFELVAQSEAILVLNYPKNGVDGYIGTSTLMEVAVAYYLHKRIYLLNNPPSFHEVRWAHEVAIMQPVVINGDLSAIG